MHKAQASTRRQPSCPAPDGVAVGTKARQQQRHVSRAGYFRRLWRRRLQQAVGQRAHLGKLQLAALAQGVPVVLQLEQGIVAGKGIILLLLCLLPLCLLRSPASQRAAQREAHSGGRHPRGAGAQGGALLAVPCPPGPCLVLLGLVASQLACRAPAQSGKGAYGCNRRR